MNYPSFFQDYKITTQDRLADTLGAFDDGMIEYSYLDVVKLSGHSCPTVAGAFLILSVAIESLYTDSIAIRGDMRVRLRDSKDTDTTGVIANILSYITGASDEGGFKGLNGNFARDNLLSFDANIDALVEIYSISQDKSIKLNYDHSPIKPNPNLQQLMKLVVSNSADSSQKQEFRKLWQERVATILDSKDRVIKIVE
jgi:hypothetical protein